jgi:hypothetical protein
MSRKLMLIAVPTLACLFTLCVVDCASSQAFAKGREMGHGPVVKNGRNGRGFGRDFRRFDRHFDRYGWNYGSYGYDVPVYEAVAPVYETVAPVETVAEPVVAPVYPTAEVTVAPTYVGYDYGFGGYKNFRHREHNPVRFHPLNNKGGMGRKG